MLNANISWTSQPGYVQEAFTHRRAEVRLIPAGMKICKLHEYKTIQNPGSRHISPWWSPYDEYDYDAGFENRVKLAKHLGVSIRELSRVVMAVKENWNSLKYLAVISLKVGIYGFFGGVAPQNRIDAGSKSKALDGEARGKHAGGKLIGLNSQFYIPNLPFEEVATVNMIVLAESAGKKLDPALLGKFG